MGFDGIYPLVMTNMAVENHHFELGQSMNIHYLYGHFLSSYVKLPGGTPQFAA